MAFVLGVVGIVASLAIALWLHMRAVSAEKELRQYFEDLPSRVGESVRSVLNSVQRDLADETVSNGQLIPNTHHNVVDHADINVDGHDELLVQYPAGAHGSAMKVFGWNGIDFEELGELRVGTPVGFEIGDFDGDGKIEVKSEETDWSLGLPYVVSPRVTLTFRWTGDSFTVIDRQKNYTELDVLRLREQFRAA